MPSSAQPTKPLATREGSPLDGGSGLIGARTHSASRHDQTGGISQANESQDRTEHVHFENTSAAEDAQQVVVSTIQKSVYGKDLTVKARGNQMLGQMADSSLKQLSQDWSNVLLRTTTGKEPEATASFNRAYGDGHLLSRE